MKNAKPAVLVGIMAVGLLSSDAGILVGEYDLNVVVSHSEFTTPVLSSPNNYYFEVTGRYGVGPLDRGDALSDAAYAAYGSPWNGTPWGPLDVRHYAVSGFSFNGVYNPRPAVDEYRTDHIYVYDLIANNQTLKVSFDDSPVYDNVGGPLHFRLFENVAAVPEPSTSLAGIAAVSLFCVSLFRSKQPQL